MSEMQRKKLFGTDGIRGLANNGTLNIETIGRVAQAAGLLLRQGEEPPLVIVGKDTRRSGYMIEDVVCAGLASAGCYVRQTGPLPTPALAMLTQSMVADFGIMITASHNSFQDNGVKIFGPDGHKISDRLEREIERLVSVGMADRLPHGDELGRSQRIEGAGDRYIERVKLTLPKGTSFKGMRVVIDCANGAGYKVAPTVLEELRAEVIAIGVTPDGMNINANCGSTSPQALIKSVRKHRANVGIALDGDADRVLMVDEHGKVIDGDQVLTILAEACLESNQLANSYVVGTVLSNRSMVDHLNERGITLLRAPVGDRHVLEMMSEYGSNLGGEQSGHMIMLDHATTGDGLMAALQVLTAVQRLGLPLSQVAHRFDPVPQVKYDAKVKRELLDHPEVVGAIKDIEAAFGEDGRLIVRASGTELLIRIMAEHSNVASAQQAVDYLASLLTSLAWSTYP